MNIDLNALDVPVFVVEVEGDVLRIYGMNTASEREFGFPNSYVAGRQFAECFSKRIAHALTERYAVCVRTRKAHQFEEFVDLPNGRQWFRTTLSPCIDPQTGSVTRIMAVSQNITAMKRMHDRMKEFAFQDPLTGLANRRGFDQAVQNTCDEAVYSQAGFSLAVVDLDGLKAMNDTHGHRLGDSVIRFVGEFLNGFVRSQEVVSRVGGDEFYLLLREPTRSELDQRLDRLRAMVDLGLRMPNYAAPITLSVGGSVWYPGDDAYEVLATADAEMYAEKGIRRLVRIAEGKVASVV